MKISKTGLFALVVALILTGGCMQSGGGGGSAASGGEPTTAENYVYKGQKDPLMAQSASDRATVMAERFKLIQGRM